MDQNQLVQITRRERLSNEEFTQLQNSLYETIWGKLFPPQILTDGLSNTLAGNVITGSDAPIPECMTCGACCAAFAVVDAEDSALPESKLWIVGSSEEEPRGRYLRRREEGFACIGLEGIIGERVSCNVYENRPSMCRKFEAGSDRCHAVRRAFGIEPFLTLDEMIEAKHKLDENLA